MTREERNLIIFDCDGVLFDSHKANLAFFDHCLSQLNMDPVTGETREKVHYLSVQQLAAMITTDSKTQEHIITTCRSQDYIPFIPLLEPTCNLEKTLAPLREHYYLAVASNRAHSLTSLFSWFNLYDHFHFKVSTLDAPPKPAPDMLQTCLRYFDLTPGKALFIGDAITDQEAAHRAGIAFRWYGAGDNAILDLEDFSQQLLNSRET